MFKIIKKGGGNFWHNFNNGSKEVNLSDWEIVLDSVNQTVSLQMLNGANVPQTSVIISDIVVIDETDGSVEETFTNITDLRNRLIELNYTPYIILNGFVPEAPIDGLTYGRKDAEWVEVSGGGSTPDATTTVKGKLKLAGDLAGTADLPTVPALALKQDTLTDVNFGAFMNARTAKNTLVDADEVVSDDSADSNKAKKTTWLNVWNNYLKPKADALYQAILTDVNLGSLINGFSSKTTPIASDGFLISNSADSNKAYKVTYTNLSATLKAYFDTIYANPGIIVKRILNNTVETTPLTGTTSETLIYSAPVISGGSFTTNDYFNFQAVFRKNVNTTGCTYRVYVSNTNNFATASLLATWASQRFNTVMERRNIYFKADNTINSTIPATTSTQTDVTNSDVALTSISLNPANDIYFFVSAQLGASGENVKMTAIKISN